MNSSRETVCTFKTAAMFCVCRIIERSEFRISTKLRRLDSLVMMFGAHHWKRKLFMKQEQRRVKIKIQNDCEEQKKGIEVNYIR